MSHERECDMKCDRCDTAHWYALRRPTPGTRLHLCLNCAKEYDDSDERYEKYVVWEEDTGDVPCNLIPCAHGMGLAGMGRCSCSGEWWNKECPYFITHDDYAAEWKARDAAADIGGGK